MAVVVLVLVLLVVAALVVSGVVLLVLLLAQRSRSTQQRGSELVPGQPGVAPTAWALSQAPEARLHRRMVDALASVRSAEPLGGLAVTDLRVQLQLHAEQLDQRLVAVASVTGTERQPALDGVARDVDELEQVAGQAVVLSAGTGPDPAALDALSSRLRMLGPGAA